MNTCDDLNDSVPDIVLYFSILDEFDHHIHIPDQILRELLSKDCDFEDKIIMDVRIHSILEISKKFSHDDRDVSIVADEIKQVQGTTTYGNISVIEVD